MNHRSPEPLNLDKVGIRRASQRDAYRGINLGEISVSHCSAPYMRLCKQHCFFLGGWGETLNLFFCIVRKLDGRESRRDLGGNREATTNQNSPPLAPVFKIPRRPSLEVISTQIEFWLFLSSSAFLPGDQPKSKSNAYESKISRNRNAVRITSKIGAAVHHRQVQAALSSHVQVNDVCIRTPHRIPTTPIGARCFVP